MHGVIIWYCEKTGRAVVWCDDSGDLAYAGGFADWRAPTQVVAIGDYVAFEMRLSGGSRSCMNLRLLEKGLAPDLADALRTPPCQDRDRKPTPVRTQWPMLVKVA